MFQSVEVIILIDAQIVSFLASGSLFKLTPASLVACLLSGMTKCSRLIMMFYFLDLCSLEAVFFSLEMLF